MKATGQTIEHRAQDPSLRRGLLALAAAGLLAAWAATRPRGPRRSRTALRPAYYDISPSELATMLENKDFLLINTHVPYEGEIEQTDLSLPYDQAAELMDQLPRTRTPRSSSTAAATA